MAQKDVIFVAEQAAQVRAIVPKLDFEVVGEAGWQRLLSGRAGERGGRAQKQQQGQTARSRHDGQRINQIIRRHITAR